MKKMNEMASIKHPCVFSESILIELAKLIPHNTTILDPFAGTGKLAQIKTLGWQGRIICNDIQPEYEALCEYPVDQWIHFDAENLNLWHFTKKELGPFDELFDDPSLTDINDLLLDGIVTSPTYGNRMADHWQPKDTSKRISYTFCLGKDLDPRNTGLMQWGKDYRDKHERIYHTLTRLVKPKGFFILNISNHIRNKQVVDVKTWHKHTLLACGWHFLREIPIVTRRMRYGANHESRPQSEYLLEFTRA
jgi:tRNA G10  N-methylase Trm11